MRKIILIFAILATNFIMVSNNVVYSKEPSRTYNTSMQYKLLEQAFIIELHPKIMSVIRKEYESDFIFDNAHVLPIRNFEYPNLEFKIEGRVKTTDTYLDTVQITFRAGREGYKVSGFKVINRESNWPLR